ncbi:hypothetical protein D3C72_1815000 [compost metagenome]
MVEFIQPAQHGLFDQDADQADEDRGDDEHGPVIDVEIAEAHPGQEGTHHVHGAVREINNVKQAEDDGQTEGQHGIERAVDETQQQLAHHRLYWNAENFHGITV